MPQIGVCTTPRKACIQSVHAEMFGASLRASGGQGGAGRSAGGTAEQNRSLQEPFPGEAGVKRIAPQLSERESPVPLPADAGIVLSLVTL